MITIHVITIIATRPITPPKIPPIIAPALLSSSSTSSVVVGEGVWLGVIRVGVGVEVRVTTV